MKPTHFNLFETQKQNYQKDKCSIQGGLYKGWYIQCPSFKVLHKIMIMDFVLLVELKTKPTTFYHHTLKYHKTKDEKIKQKKIFQKLKNLE